MIEIQPVRDETTHRRALETIEALWGASSDSQEGSALEVLITLVDAYEATHHPILPPDPIQAILFRMDQLGLTRRDLEPYIGTRARVSEVLNGRRTLTLPMIRRLRQGLGISADLLLGA